jgi:hypothetical protein
MFLRQWNFDRRLTICSQKETSDIPTPRTTPYVTKTGCVLTDIDVEAIADDVAGSIDVDALKPPRRGRPPLEGGPADVVPVRLRRTARRRRSTRQNRLHNHERRDPRSTSPLPSRRLRTLLMNGVDGRFWTPLDLEAEIEWLRDRSDRHYSCGIDSIGWEASIWILHSMYESSSSASNLTHHDVHRSALDAGLVEPTVSSDSLTKES